MYVCSLLTIVKCHKIQIIQKVYIYKGKHDEQNKPKITTYAP